MFSTVSFPLIPVAGHKPPEELLALNAGSFGRWQICVVAISLLAVFIHGLDVYSSKVAALHTLNYSCAEENSTRCHYANGTNCEVFTFNHSFVTFTEKFGLVCEYEDLGIWIKNSFRIGMSVGYLMTGWSADRLGQKITAMVFLPLQSLLGVFLLSITNFSMLLFFAVIQGSSASTVNLLPKIAVCEAVGNKWRTLVMGIALLPMPMSLVMAPFIFVKLGDINKVIAVISVLPLVLLVPMLYFRDSPNNILLSNDFKKAEDSIRRIAQFNKQPMPQDIKIRPVQLIVCMIASHQNHICVTYFGLFLKCGMLFWLLRFSGYFMALPSI